MFHPASFRRLPAWQASLLLTWVIASLPVSAQEDALLLGDFLERVLTYNEQLQVQLMEYEVSLLAVQGAKGVFEPEMVLRAQYDDTLRPNNAEELRNLGGLQFFQQRQWLYSAAVEMLTTSGARTRIGLDVRNINNNLQPFRSVDQEWSTFFGLSIVQPLLKGAGKIATLAALRVASLESDQAYQEFRRQSMVILVGAEVAYWNLYFAQEQRRFYEESLATVKTLATDVTERFEAGKASQLDVLNARVAVGDREGKFAVAQQGLTEAANIAAGFAGPDAVRFHALPPPPHVQVEFDSETCFAMAQRSNPEFIVRQRQIAIEALRLDAAKNQGRPTLDFLASFGLAGLSDSSGEALEQVGENRYPTWSVGLEFRLPLGGGRQSKAEIQTAALRKRQAIQQMSLIRTQMRAAVENSLAKIVSAQTNAASFHETVNLHEQLLQTELERVTAGTSTSSKVIEAEQALFEARNLELDNITEYQRALLELDVIMGTVLEKRGIDCSRAQLANKTAGLIRERDISQAALEAYQKALGPIIEQNP